MEPILQPFIHALLRHCGEAVLVSDDRALENGGPQILAATPLAHLVTGCTADELNGKPARELFATPGNTAPLDPSADPLWQALESAASHRGRVSINGQPRTPAQEWQLEVLPIPATDGRATRFAWLLNAHAETAHPLSAGCERAASTIDPEVVLVYDEQGTLRYASSALERLLGARPHELLGRSVANLCPQHEREEIHDELTSFGTATLATPRAAPVHMRASHLREPRWLTLELDLLRYTVARTSEGSNSQRPPDVIAAYVRDVTPQHKQAREESGRLTVQVAHASETGKQQVSNELREGLGQVITGAAFLAKTVLDQLQREQHPLVERAGRVNRLLVEAIETVRTMSALFTPLLDRTLADALSRLAEMVTSRCGVCCEVEILGEAGELPESVGTQLYWIAQEAVMNAVRHANASRIQVRYSTVHAPQLLIEDDGDGLCSSAVTGQGPVGLGLRIMQCRAEQIGWKVELRCPSRGTQVICEPAPRKSQRIPRPREANPPSSSTSREPSSAGGEMATISTDDSHDSHP